MRLPGRRFDVVETCLIAVFAAMAGALAFRATSPDADPEAFVMPELVPYRETFGPDRHSQRPEEWLVRDFFGDRRNGFFVDVGASHYQVHSNTYYLDVELGWEGIAIEPLVQFQADYAKYRPRTRFRPFFVSDRSDETATLYTVNRLHRMSSGVEDYTKRTGEAVSQVTVPTITLDDLLSAEGVERIDFMSMDIELWEPKALAGFNLRRFRPSLVCVEGQPEVRQALLDYFAAGGYVLVGRYLRADIWNLYFTPLDGTGPAVPVSAPER